MVKTSLCDFCLRSGVLCSSCRQKVKSGVVTPLYIKSARLLVDLEKKYPSIERISLHQVVDTGDAAALLVGRGEIPYVLSRGGRIVREIERAIGKDVRVLEMDSSDKKFLEDLFAPYPIVAMNRIWLPDRSIITGVILKVGRRKIPEKRLEESRAIAKKLRNMVLRIELLA